MELLLLVPLVWVSRKISFKWKTVAAALALVEVVHVIWVMSIAPLLAKAEKVPLAFSSQYLVSNLKANLTYLFNPYRFFAAITVVALAAALSRKARAAFTIPAFGLFCVYLMFYAGSFDTNPRYSIQMLAPIAVLAASLMKGRLALLLISIVVPYTRPYEVSSYAQSLAADHRISVQFASHMNPNDLIVSAEPEVFLNHDHRAMNAVFALDRKEKLEEEIRRGKVWYHSGVRTNVEDSQEWIADRWVKSSFELHLIDAQEVGGMRIAFYEVLLKPIDRETGQGTTLQR
jgi:hypothetical protein